eukprot:COSAG02_NODE_105_length_36393_cov_15.694495_15_plen_97_part_00
MDLTPFEVEEVLSGLKFRTTISINSLLHLSVSSIGSTRIQPSCVYRTKSADSSSIDSPLLNAFVNSYLVREGGSDFHDRFRRDKYEFVKPIGWEGC